MATSLQAADVSRVYQGELDNLPRQESNIIKLFLSSTFTDYAEERNHLMRNAIPRLKNFCLERGIDFQVADMRWGVRDDAQIEHKTTEIVIEEVKKCREESRGTYFVAFLGNKYGYRPYPGQIEESEFVTLVRATRTAGKDASLLEKWFKKDENIVPPVYRFLPITTYFPYYDDENPEHEEQRKSDREEWNAVNELLASTFRTAAYIACKYGKITADRMHKYFRSVTESEVATGILEAGDAKQRTLCFRRNISDIKHSDNLAWRFEDLEGGLPDTEAEEYLEDLKHIKVPQQLSPDELVDSCVQWTEKGIDPKNNAHSEYLDKFSNDFFTKVSGQIVKCLDKVDLPTLDKGQLNEVLHHSDFTNQKTKNFCGRIELLTNIKNSLLKVKTKSEIVVQEVELPDDEHQEEPTPRPTPRKKDKDKEEDEEEEGDDGKSSIPEVKVDRATPSADDQESGADDQAGDLKSERESLSVRDDSSRDKSEASDQGSNDDQQSSTQEEPNPPENDQNSKAEVESENVIHDSTEEEDETVTEDMVEEREAKADDDVASENNNQTNENKMETELYDTEEEEEAQDELTELGKEHDMTRKHLKEMGVAFALELDEMPEDEKVAKYLVVPELDTFTVPLILYGDSGSGKTSVMAKVVQMAPKWFDNPDIVRIVRYLGTSPKTSTIKDTMLSICQQVIDSYGVDEIIPHLCVKDFSALVLYFAGLLTRIDTENRPLLIALDSIDQLSPDYYTFAMSWLPIAVPEGVHIILSTIPQMHSILENTRKRIHDSSCFIEIPRLPKDTATVILNTWLAESNKRLTTEQTEFVLKNFATCAQPLFLKVAFEQAKQWTSYTPSSDWIIGLTIRSAIEQLFSRLEKEHGQVLVSKALGYLTTAKAGLSDAEMEDILSLDDEVLQDTYLYHLPPNPDLIRLAPLLWRRLKYDLKEYLVERQADEKNVVSWYHRQFRETAIKRYVYKTIRSDFHYVISEYFQGKWASVAKPLELFKKKKGSYPNALRGVPEQPLQYSKNTYNTRALSELPFQLLNAKLYEEFVKTCCSYDWIYAKSKAFNIFAVMLDLKLATVLIEKEIDEGGKANVIAFVTEGDKESQASLDINDEIQEAIESITGNDEQKGEEETENSDTEEANEQKTAGNFVQEHSTSDLKYIVEEIKKVMDLLQMSIDFISRDANNLASQIIGQLGSLEKSSPVLEKLRVDADDWARHVRSPVLFPQSQCLPTPGQWLKTSVNFNVSFPGDAPENEMKFGLSADGRILYGAERTRSESDVLKLIDVTEADVIHQQQLRGISIQKAQLVCNDKYLLVGAYKRREKYNPDIDQFLFDLRGHNRVMLPPDTFVLRCSKKNPFIIVVGGGLNQDFLPGTEPDQAVMKTIAQVYNLETRKQTYLKANVKGNVKVIQAEMNPDETTLILVGEGKYTSAFVFAQDSANVNKYKHTRTVVLEEKVAYQSFGGRTYLQVKVVSSNRLVHTGVDYKTQGTVYISDLTEGNRLIEFKTSEHYSVDFMQVSPDMQTIAVGTTSDGIINGVWTKPLTVIDVEHLRVRCTCDADGPYSAIAYCGDRSDLILTCSTRGSHVSVWFVGSDAVDGILLFSLYGHAEMITYIQVTPDIKTLITASTDNTVKFWSMANIISSCDERIESIQDLIQASYGGDTEASDKIRKTLSLDTSKPFRVGEGQQKASSTTVSKSGKIAAVGTVDGWLIFYDLASLEIIAFYNEGSNVHSLLTTRSGKYIVSAAKEIKLWDPNSGKAIRTLAHGGKAGRGRMDGAGGGHINCLDESCDILVGGYGGMECFGVLWDLNTGEIIKQLQGLYGFNKVAITSDAKIVVSTMFDFPMVFDVATGEPKDFGQPDTMMSGCTCIRISSDDQLVVTCSTDGSVRVTDLNTGKYKFRMQHKSTVVEATFTPDTASLLTAGFKNILVWSMQNGQLLYTMSRHQDFITRMKFCFDGRFLVTASKDKEIVVWDYNERVSISTFLAHCPLMDVSVADDLSSILYSPVNVAYLGVLKPNRRLRRIVRGRGEERVQETVQKAQAFALAFSSQKVADKSSRACNIL